MQLEDNEPKKHRKRKNVHGDPEAEMHHDESNWLVSYADMMTLLFGFFVLMYSFSKLDKDKFKVVRKELTTYFGGKIVEDKVIEDMKQQLQNILGEKSVDRNEFNVIAGDDKIILQMNNELLFASGSAELSSKSQPMIQKLFKSILAKKVIDEVQVEGHTDAVPMKSFVYPSNWELSSARASSLVRQFEKLGVERRRMLVKGFGSSRPLVPNADKKGKWIKENLKKNRRVVIQIDFGQNQEAAKESLDNKEVKLNKGDTALNKKTNQPRAPQRSKASVDPRKAVKKPENLEAQNVGRVKKASAPVDLLKDRLLKAEKKFKEANKKAQAAKKKRAAEAKLMQKIKQLEDRTKRLEEESP